MTGLDGDDVLRRDEAWFAQEQAKRARWQRGGEIIGTTSGGVESRHAGSAASLNWGVGAAQVKTASADTTADLSGESGMPSVQLRPAGMRPEVRPHADNQGTAGVAPGPLTIKERDVLSAVLELLQVHPRVAWAERFNTGGMENANGQYVRFAFPGCSDILGQLKDGRLLAIECKRPGKKATAEQWQFLCNVNRANGVAFVATCIEDVTRALT